MWHEYDREGQGALNYEQSKEFAQMLLESKKQKLSESQLGQVYSEMNQDGKGVKKKDAIKFIQRLSITDKK